MAMDMGLEEWFSVMLFLTLRNEFVSCEDEVRRTRRREKLL